MSGVYEHTGDDGEKVYFFGAWRDTEPQKLSENAQTLHRWLRGEDIPIDFNLIRKEFHGQEQFRQGMKLFIDEAVEILKQRAIAARENISRPISTHEQWDQGYAVAGYKANAQAAQLLNDIVNAAGLELSR